LLKKKPDRMTGEPKERPFHSCTAFEGNLPCEKVRRVGRLVGRQAVCDFSLSKLIHVFVATIAWLGNTAKKS
jgi:hypothetical protein